MKNFGIGLALGLVGLIICVVVWFVGGMGEAIVGREMPLYHFFMAVGRVIGIGGPLTYWIILPIVKLIRR